MKLSIIIPVYNCEKYLSKCLESVLHQDFDDYEVIAINDGSTDGSGKIIHKFAGQYSKFVVINQKNSGVSTARNAGLDVAKGEFITFVDSDDAIYPNSLAIILEKLDVEKLDVFYPQIENYSEEGIPMGIIPFPAEPNEVKKGIEQGRRTFTPTFYRRSIVGKIRFHDKISLGEDTVFNAMVQAFANRVSHSEIPYYKYLFRENSLSQKAFTEEAYRGFLLAISELRKFQHQHFAENTDAKNYFDKIFTILVTRIIEWNIMPKWNKKRYEEMTILLKRENLLYILDGFSKKYPFVNTSFFKFKYYQNYLTFKSKIYKLIYRA